MQFDADLKSLFNLLAHFLGAPAVETLINSLAAALRRIRLLVFSRAGARLDFLALRFWP